MEMTRIDFHTDNRAEYRRFDPSDQHEPDKKIDAQNRLLQLLLYFSYFLLFLFLIEIGWATRHSYTAQEKFEQKFNTLHNDITDMKQKIQHTDNVILSLHSNSAETNVTLNTIIQLIREVNNQTHDMIKTLDNLIASSNTTNKEERRELSEKFGSVAKEVQNLHEKIGDVNESTSFLKINVNATREEMKNLTSRTQQLFAMLQEPNWRCVLENPSRIPGRMETKSAGSGQKVTILANSLRD